MASAVNKVAGGNPGAAKSTRGPAFEAKRMDILRGAALLFAENGYHKTSVNMLSEKLGISKPVLYYYAENKDDILQQISAISRDQLRVAMERAQRTKLSGIGKLRHFFMAYTEIMCSDLGRCFALVERNGMSPGARDNDTAGRRQIDTAVRDIIVEGQAEGSIARCSPELATRALFGAFNAIPRWYKEGGAFDARDVAEAYIDFFVTGLGRG